MSHLAYGHRGLALAVALVISGSLACTAGVRSSSAGTGGAGATTVTGAGGSTGGSRGSGGLYGTGGSSTGDVHLSGTGGNPDAAACQQKDVMFTPTNPTVYLLVDRSGSMFHCLDSKPNEDMQAPLCTNNGVNPATVDIANTEWSNLKTAIEQVLPQLDSQVRFGFTTVWGQNPAGGGMCPSLQGMLTDSVAPALNNAAAIAAKYDSLQPPMFSTSVGVKFESPISESIANVAAALAKDPTPGSKYILLITDGQPDYCDDSNSICAPDSVVWKLQSAYTAGIPTIVFGIQSKLFDLPPGILQAFANAGAGEPTLPPVPSGQDANAFYDQCSGVTGWASDLTAKGLAPMRGDTLGTYSTSMGPTTPYTPNASDVTMLVTQLSKALSGVRSCTFDLSTFQIDADKLDEAIVYLQDDKANETIPLDKNKTDGWYMTDITATTGANGQVMHSATQLELYGSWCDKLRAPTTTDIKFNFPCDIIIVVN